MHEECFFTLNIQEENVCHEEEILMRNIELFRDILHSYGNGAVILFKFRFLMFTYESCPILRVGRGS